MTPKPYTPTIGDLVLVPSVSDGPCEFLGWCPMSNAKDGFVRRKVGDFVHRVDLMEIQPYTGAPNGE